MKLPTVQLFSLTQLVIKVQNGLKWVRVIAMSLDGHSVKTRLEEYALTDVFLPSFLRFLQKYMQALHTSELYILRNYRCELQFTVRHKEVTTMFFRSSNPYRHVGRCQRF
jgi:hypothetical protein